MKKTMSMIVSCAVIASMLTACGTSETSNSKPNAASTTSSATDATSAVSSEDSKTEEKTDEASSSYHVEIDNYNRTTVYTEVPKRIVSLSYSETEILVALGLEDKIVGIAEADNVLDDCAPKYRDTISGLNIISSTAEGGVPTLETLLTVDPDFVYATSYALNSESGVGELSDFENYNMNVYVSSTTYKPTCSIDDVYEDIRNIGKIFQVEDKADALISEMESKINDVTKVTTNISDPVKAFAYIGGNDSRAATVGGNALANDLMTKAGVVNVFGDEQEGMFGVGIEAIVQANPDVIILFSNAGGSGMSSASDKKDFLKSLDVLKDVTAIKEDRFVEIPDFTMNFGTAQNAEAVEALAKAIYPDLFA